MMNHKTYQMYRPSLFPSNKKREIKKEKGQYISIRFVVQQSDSWGGEKINQMIINI